VSSGGRVKLRFIHALTNLSHLRPICQGSLRLLCWHASGNGPSGRRSGASHCARRRKLVACRPREQRAARTGYLLGNIQSVNDLGGIAQVGAEHVSFSSLHIFNTSITHISGNVTAVPVPESQPTHLETPNGETASDSSYSETGWTSSEDEDEDVGESEREEMRQARTLEQIRVLHAAGLLVGAEDAADQDSSTQPKAKPDIPDRLLKRRKTKKGTKPDRPHRRSSNRREKGAPDRPLPPPPARPSQHEEAEVPLEDAFDRYVRLSKEVIMRPVQSSVANPALLALPSSPPPLSSGDDARGSGLLNTIKSMSRGRASDIERRSTPKISGPISSPQLADSQFSAQGARASPALGTASGGASWSALVGENALEMIPEKERNRQEAIFEFILTESSHVRDLQIIVEVFFNSMQSLLSDKASTVIFANIEDVLLAAVSFLSDLEQRQRESRLYLDQIADVLQRHMPSMQA
jgi:actin cytoskeleton-regulatory complex protein PAN1